MRSVPHFALIAVLLTGCASSTSAPVTDDVTIDRIVAVSDGDHLASTYVDGTLADPDAGFRDQLTTVRVINGRVETAHVDVPNSVTAAPEVLALSPDGRTAFVAERLAQRQPGDSRADQLAAGRRLTAVDVADLGAPTVRSSVTVAENPESIGMSPDGRRIAVVANTADAAVLDVVDWSDSGFGRVQRIDLASIGITGTAQLPRGGVLATNVHWHPSGRAIAINIDTQDRVALFQVAENPDGTVALTPWGNVKTGPDPFVGRFTPDGRHYVTANWGRDLTTTVAAQRLPRGPSTLTVIRLADIADRTGAHRVVASAESDKSSEGLAISPDGTLIATVNMRGTVFPPQSPLFDGEGSVSLLRLDVHTGNLTKIGDYPLTAVLPEGGTFDDTGRFFIATSFEGRGPGDGGPAIQIYRVDASTGLTPVQRVSLPHGVHHVVVG